jgi:DNA repair exonuclease SbcCD ATPase subunit
MAGAAAGAMFGGPVGAVVGGAAGAVKTYMDNEGEKSAISKEFEQSEKIYAAIREKNALFEKLSNTKNGTDIASNLAKAKEVIENYTETTADFVQQVRDELKRMHPDKEKIAKLRRNIDYNRGEIQRYEGLVKALSEQDEQRGPIRGSMSALDSLGKIGGNFVGSFAEKAAQEITEVASTSSASGGGSFGFVVKGGGIDTSEFSARSEGLLNGYDSAIKTANERIEKIDADQLSVLREIKETLEKQGGPAWQ